LLAGAFGSWSGSKVRSKSACAPLAHAPGVMQTAVAINTVKEARQRPGEA
jgi:hypothetical protein